MRRLRIIFLRLLGLLLVLSLIALLAIGWLGSARLISPPRRALQDYHREILDDPARFGLSVTNFTSTGDTPCLMVTPARKPKPAHKSRQLRQSLRTRGIEPPRWGEIRGTVVLLHGHTGRKEDHLPICERFFAAGFRCLLPDLPSHGDHPSNVATFGKNEAELIEDILEDAAVTFGFNDQPAFLFGISQGGAIALQTAARSPERWSGIASAASFSSLDRAIRDSAESIHPKLHACASLNSFAVHCGSWCRSGMWPSDIRPRDAASQLHMPVMIIHGESDSFIGIDHAHEIFKALPSPTKVFRPVPEAGHGRVLAQDADQLYPEICGFFLKAIDGTLAMEF